MEVISVKKLVVFGSLVLCAVTLGMEQNNVNTAVQQYLQEFKKLEKLILLASSSLQDQSQLASLNPMPVQKETFYCFECGKVFNWDKSLRRHRVTVHNWPVYKCTFLGCTRTFYYDKKDEFDKHTKKHSIFKKNFLCDFCNRLFSSQRAKSLHVELTHPTQFNLLEMAKGQTQLSDTQVEVESQTFLLPISAFFVQEQ